MLKDIEWKLSEPKAFKYMEKSDSRNIKSPRRKNLLLSMNVHEEKSLSSERLISWKRDYNSKTNAFLTIYDHESLMFFCSFSSKVFENEKGKLPCMLIINFYSDKICWKIL